MGSTLREGTTYNFLEIFSCKFSPLCTECAYRFWLRTDKSIAAYREHTDRQTDNVSFINTVLDRSSLKRLQLEENEEL